MAMNKNRRRPPPLVEALETREAPTASPWLTEAFDRLPDGALPAGWSRWAAPEADVGASAGRSVSAPSGLAVTAGRSTAAARTWMNAAVPADARAGAAIYLDSLIPAQVIARGRNLGTASPSYYALALTRGMRAELVRVADGVATVLGSVQSRAWLSGRWVRASLDVQDDRLRAEVYRPDTGQYLNAAGEGPGADRRDAGRPGTGRPGPAAELHRHRHLRRLHRQPAAGA
jgi:hypothetical protein